MEKLFFIFILSLYLFSCTDKKGEIISSEVNSYTGETIISNNTTLGELIALDEDGEPFNKKISDSAVRLLKQIESIRIKTALEVLDTNNLK